MTWAQPGDGAVIFDTYGDGWSQPYVYVCKWQNWSYAWHACELLIFRRLKFEHFPDEKLFLLYGLWLCYKARSTTWVECWQFTFAVAIELIACFLAVSVSYLFDVWPDKDPDMHM